MNKPQQLSAANNTGANNMGGPVSNNAGSTTRSGHPVMGVATVVLSLIGLLASFALIQSEFKILADPSAELACDLNPLIGCSTSILSPQAHIFGIPNSVIGVAAFAALLVLGVILACRGSLPRRVWWSLAVGAVGAVVFVGYFLYHSAFTFHSLCPYCLVVWGATLAIIPLLLGGAASEGAFGAGPTAAGKAVLRYSWALTLLLYLLVVLFIVVAMPDRIGYLFS